jgi:hypothetical protein
MLRSGTADRLSKYARRASSQAPPTQLGRWGRLLRWPARVCERHLARWKCFGRSPSRHDRAAGQAFGPLAHCRARAMPNAQVGLPPQRSRLLGRWQDSTWMVAAPPAAPGAQHGSITNRQLTSGPPCCRPHSGRHWECRWRVALGCPFTRRSSAPGAGRPGAEPRRRCLKCCGGRAQRQSGRSCASSAALPPRPASEAARTDRARRARHQRATASRRASAYR